MDDWEKSLEDLQAKIAAETKAAADMMNQDNSVPEQSAAPIADSKEKVSSESATKEKDPEPTPETTAALGAAKNAGKTHLTGAEHAVRRLNKTYALVHIGSDIQISVDMGKYYEFWKVSAFEKTMRKEPKVIVTTARGSKSAYVSEVWLDSPDRKDYRKIDFLPFEQSDPDVLNLWRGFGVEKIQGISFFAAARGCWKFLKHVRNNICKGSSEEFQYFMRWCADLIQRPHIKSGVAVTITGKKGVGKSKVAEAMAALLGEHQITVSMSDQLTGRFNSHLAQSLLVVSEEAIWGGNRAAAGPLKHLITSPDLALERKGVDIIKVKNLSRFIIVGNEHWQFPATEDERRLLALECGDKHRKDFDYFEAIDVELYGHKDGKQGNPQWAEGSGLRSFMTFLSLIDLSKFNIRGIPETAGLRNQREESMESHEKFFRDRLSARRIGYVRDEIFDTRNPATWDMEGKVITKEDIYENDYVGWHKTHHSRSAATPRNTFWRWVKATFGWSSCRVGGKGGQVYAVNVDGWKHSMESFLKSTKINSIEDEESY